MIKYNGKNLTQLLDLVIAAKEIPTPTRKEVTETVPYMSGEWDFSFLDGVDYYEPSILKYSFDIIADTKRELNELRKQAVKLFMERGNGKFYDTDISDTAFYKVYRVNTSWSEEGLQGLLTVELKCYPFMINEITKTITASNSSQDVLLLNDESYRPSKVSFVVSGSITVQHHKYSASGYTRVGVYTITSGTHNDAFTIYNGDRLTITGSGSVTITVAGELIF